MPAAFDSTHRFSTRVADYRRARPAYPPEIVDLLERTCGWTPAAVVADIGAGTGLLARRFLERGGRVVGVEPNEAMRRAGEEELADFGDLYTSVPGTAEATTLEAASVDLIATAQAFHWFDVPAARREFARILRPGGHIVLIWNHRRTGGSPFLEDYERLLLAYGRDYEAITARQTDRSRVRDLFGGSAFGEAVFPNAQVLDLAGLTTRLLSASYVPPATDPAHTPMLAELARIFAAHQEGGRVRIEYDTQVFYGTVDPGPEQAFSSSSLP